MNFLDEHLPEGRHLEEMQPVDAFDDVDGAGHDEEVPEDRAVQDAQNPEDDVQRVAPVEHLGTVALRLRTVLRRTIHQLHNLYWLLKRRTILNHIVVQWLKAVSGTRRLNAASDHNVPTNYYYYYLYFIFSILHYVECISYAYMYMYIRLYNLCTSNCYFSCSFLSPASVTLTIILIYNIYLYVIIHYVSCTIHVYEIKYLNLNLNLYFDIVSINYHVKFDQTKQNCNTIFIS